MKKLLKQLETHHNLIFIDIEGTQFSHEVIQIGVVKAKIGNNEVLSEETYNAFVKPLGAIGRIVENMTGITLETLKKNSITVEQMIDELASFIGDLKDTLIFTFGTGDKIMFDASLEIQKPKNSELGYKLSSRFIDFLPLISKYVSDPNHNPYSLTKYLEIYNINIAGRAHDGLVDALGLKDLFFSFIDNKEVLFESYMQKIYKSNKLLPKPVQDFINEVVQDNDELRKNLEDKVREFLND